jgi:flagellar assembly protein FliH
MLSKLHRGGSAVTEPISWRSVGSPLRQSTTFPGPNEQEQGHEVQNRNSALEREVEERAQAAYRTGLQEGDAAARQQVGAQTDAALSRLARTIEEISGLRQRFRHEAEAEVVKLAIAIARRVLHRELTVDAGALLGIVKAALEKLDSRELHNVRIHPGSAATLRQLLERMGLPARVEVIADAALERGAVIFETARGAMDASIETQLSEIERGFSDLVRNTP